MKQKISLVAVTLALAFFVSCNDSDKKSHQEGQKSKIEHVENKTVKKDCKDVHWLHQIGHDGPENWKNLCDGFMACGGHSQSPINIINKSVIIGKDLVKPEFDYAKSKVNIINNGHTVQFNIDGGNNVNLNGKNYSLLQFHYHALSEHTIDGKHSPIEVHFVHKHSDTDFAVIGAVYIEGKENELLSNYLEKFPTNEGEFKSDKMIDLLKILPNNKSYYYYKGSLTTPPCSEVVNWYILNNPIEASKKQIEKFSTILNKNYRPVMPLNDREILLFRE